MRRWELKLPHDRPPLSLNQRIGWQQRHRVTDELLESVGWLLKDSRMPCGRVPALDHAWIWLEWTPGTVRGRDTDNPEPTRKVAVDAIVRAGLLPDDTPEYVTRPENVIHPAILHRRATLLVVITDADPLPEQIAARRRDVEFMGRLKESIAADHAILERLKSGDRS